MAILPPINEVSSEVVRVNIPLPEYAHPEKIGVNVELIEGLCRLSGIRQLSIGTFNEGDKISAIAQNVGGGVGTALGIKSKTAQKIRYEQTGDHPQFPKYMQWSDSHVDFNTQKIQEDVVGMKGGLHKQSNWISLLNSYVRKGVSRACSKNLLRVNAQDFILEACLFSGGMIVNGQDLMSLLRLPIIRGLGTCAHKIINDTTAISPFTIRPACSILGLEIDRSIALAVRSLRHRNDFVKEIKDEECE